LVFVNLLYRSQREPVPLFDIPVSELTGTSAMYIFFRSFIHLHFYQKKTKKEGEEKEKTEAERKEMKNRNTEKQKGEEEEEFPLGVISKSPSSAANSATANHRSVSWPSPFLLLLLQPCDLYCYTK
jgi:hypothetical protein